MPSLDFIRGNVTGFAADVNPIGAISKTDLKKFIAYARDAFELPVLNECVRPSHVRLQQTS